MGCSQSSDNTKKKRGSSSKGRKGGKKAGNKKVKFKGKQQVNNTKRPNGGQPDNSETSKSGPTSAESSKKSSSAEVSKKPEIVNANPLVTKTIPTSPLAPASPALATTATPYDLAAELAGGDESSNSKDSAMTSDSVMTRDSVITTDVKSNTHKKGKKVKKIKGSNKKGNGGKLEAHRRGPVAIPPDRVVSESRLKAVRVWIDAGDTGMSTFGRLLEPQDSKHQAQRESQVEFDRQKERLAAEASESASTASATTAASPGAQLPPETKGTTCDDPLERKKSVSLTVAQGRKDLFSTSNSNSNPIGATSTFSKPLEISSSNSNSRPGGIDLGAHLAKSVKAGDAAPTSLWQLLKGTVVASEQEVVIEPDEDHIGTRLDNGFSERASLASVMEHEEE